MRKKKGNLENEPKEKKTRAKYKCPDEIAVWLFIMKEYVPPDFILPEWKYERDISNEFYRPEYTSVSCNSNEDTAIFYKEFNAFINEEIGKLKYPVIYMAWKFLGLEMPRLEIPTMQEIASSDKFKSVSFYLGSLVAYYRIAQASIEIMRQSATFFEKVRKGELPQSSSVSFHIPATISITPQGKALAKSDLKLLNAINSIEFDRLRVCEICNQIFWANYKNSFTCSTPCLNALRQRRHRKKNKEVINAKRKANYDRNKKLKQLKEKKNGTL